MGSQQSRKEPSRQLVNFYSEHLHMVPRHGYPQCMSYMNIHGHTWTSLGCRPKSTCKVDGLLPSRNLASPCVLNHVGVTTIERLDQKEKSHPDSLLISIRNIYIGVRDNPLILYLNVQNYYYRIPPTLFILCFKFLRDVNGGLIAN